MCYDFAGFKHLPFPPFNFIWLNREDIPGGARLTAAGDGLRQRLCFSPGVHYVWPDFVLPPPRCLSEA